MIINHSKRFIFIHVPKAAGTTVTERLSEYSRYCDLEIGGTSIGEMVQPYYWKRFGLRKHSTAQEVRSVVGADVWDKYFSFSFVRCPFSRVESTYRFLKSWTQAPPLVREKMESLSSFREFLLSSFWSETSGPDGMFNSQLSWLTMQCGETDRNRSIVNFVGRCESLEAELSEIEGQLGIHCEKSTRPLKRLNATVLVGARENGLSECWTSEMVKMVVERYRDDFAEFGYSAYL